MMVMVRGFPNFITFYYYRIIIDIIYHAMRRCGDIDDVAMPPQVADAGWLARAVILLMRFAIAQRCRCRTYICYYGYSLLQLFAAFSLPPCWMLAMLRRRC